MPLIPNKRASLAHVLRGAGLLGLLERLARRPGLLVLTYHRIGDPSERSYYAPVASATAEGLAAELLALKTTHRVLRGDELPGLVQSGFRVDEPSALITFDDGYRDNFEVALPVLSSLGVPATFFLPTAFFQAPKLPWWDHIAYVLDRTEVPVLRLDWPEPLEVDLTRTSHDRAVARVVRMYLDHQAKAESDDRRFRAGLEDRAGVHVDEDRLGRDLFMTWDQARALVAAGMSVGSHAHRHRSLAHLDEAEQRRELVESRAILEAEIGSAMATLAYPYGWPGTFDGLTMRLAREAGYQLAFSSIEGVNAPRATEPFAVKRLGVGFADPPVLHRARWALYETFGRSIL